MGKPITELSSAVLVDGWCHTTTYEEISLAVDMFVYSLSHLLSADCDTRTALTNEITDMLVGYAKEMAI